MSEKLGVLISWLESVQASNELTFDSIESLHELYRDSNQSITYPISITGFRRLINQIIDWNLSTIIYKIKRRTIFRNRTYYFICSKLTTTEDYTEPDDVTEESSSVIPPDQCIGIQLSHQTHGASPSVTYPSDISPSVTSPGTSPSVTSPSTLYPSLTSPSQILPSTSNTNIEMPILSQLDGNIQDSFNSVLTEVVKYSKHKNHFIKFNYTSNGKKGLLVNIPSAKSNSLFKKYERRTSWLEPMLEHINSSSPSDATEWLIDLLRSFSSDAFEKVCSKYGYSKHKQLDAVATAAMWTESNASLVQSRIIL